MINFRSVSVFSQLNYQRFVTLLMKAQAQNSHHFTDDSSKYNFLINIVCVSVNNEICSQDFIRRQQQAPQEQRILHTPTLPNSQQAITCVFLWTWFVSKTGFQPGYMSHDSWKRARVTLHESAWCWLTPNSKVHGAYMGPPGYERTKAGHILAPWTLLSGTW